MTTQIHANKSHCAPSPFGWAVRLLYHIFIQTNVKIRQVICSYVRIYSVWYKPISLLALIQFLVIFLHLNSLLYRCETFCVRWMWNAFQTERISETTSSQHTQVCTFTYAYAPYWSHWVNCTDGTPYFYNFACIKHKTFTKYKPWTSFKYHLGCRDLFTVTLGRLILVKWL